MEGGEGTERCPGVLGVWEGELGVSRKVRVGCGYPNRHKNACNECLRRCFPISGPKVCVLHTNAPSPCSCPLLPVSMPLPSSLRAPTHHGMRRGARREGPARVQRPAHPGCSSQQGMNVALVARLGAGGRLRGEGGVAVGEQAGRGQPAIRLWLTTAAAAVVVAAGGLHEG